MKQANDLFTKMNYHKDLTRENFRAWLCFCYGAFSVHINESTLRIITQEAQRVLARSLAKKAST